MTKKHLVFVINPKSGIERQKEIKDGVERYIDKDRFSYELLYSAFPNHGITLAKEAARNGAYAVVAVGGDGSVNDVVHGLTGSDTLLGIIPKGSGNGMARTMGIPLGTGDAIKLINNGNVVSMDIGYANDQPFISNAGVAFDALISKKFGKSDTRGFFTYSWLVTKYLWLYKSWDWEITVDGKQFTEKAFMVTVANGQQFGYNFKIAPMADFTDGLLDLVVIRRFPKILASVIAYRAMHGSIAESPYVQHFRGKEITVFHPRLKLMQTDGDAHPCGHLVKFTVQKGVQRVIVP